MRSCNRLHQKHSDTPVLLSPNYRFLAGAYPLGSASVSFWIHPHKNSTAGNICQFHGRRDSPWRSGYLSKLCWRPRLVPTPDKKPCEAGASLPSASSFPCACAQGDERLLRRVTTPQAIEMAKDGKRSSLHQPFLGRVSTFCQTSGPTAHLANTSVITLRQPTNRALPCTWSSSVPCAARSAISKRQTLCFAFITRITHYKTTSKPCITSLSTFMSRQDQHRGTDP